MLPAAGFALGVPVGSGALTILQPSTAITTFNAVAKMAIPTQNGTRFTLAVYQGGPRLAQLVADLQLDADPAEEVCHVNQRIDVTLWRGG